MAIALFPATFAPGRAGVFAAGVAHAAGLAVALQTQLSSAGRACPTLLDRLVAGWDLLRDGGIGRQVTFRRRCAGGTDGARRAQRIDAQASGGRLASCPADLTASPRTEIVRATGFAARRVRSCGWPVAFVDEARRAKRGTRAPAGSGVAHGSQPIVAYAARYGRYRRCDHQEKTSAKQVPHDFTSGENSATSRLGRHVPNHPDSKGHRQGSSRFCEPSELPACCRPGHRTTRRLSWPSSRRSPSGATEASMSRPRAAPSRRSHASRCWPADRASTRPWMRPRPSR